MDQEKSSAEKVKRLLKPPGMFVIKGRQSDHVYLPVQSLYAELRRFARIKDEKTLLIHLPLDNSYSRLLKRSVDIVVSLTIIITILSWLIPVMAVLIKLDSKGPVFFLQKRNKRNGGVFNCLKFRSMIENDEADDLPASKDDKRITRLGRFLRNSFIDELPQFFNVFVGDMSLIGPRPHMISDNNKYEELIEYYDFRHKVKPGITGLSQVMGYVGETKNVHAMRDRVQLDIFYIRHWSFGFDMRIMWHTFRKLVKA